MRVLTIAAALLLALCGCKQKKQAESSHVPATHTDVPCGEIVQLNQEGFGRLDLLNRLEHLVAESGFTSKELDELMSADDLEEEAFRAYSLAYLGSNKGISQSDVDKAFETAQSATDINALSRTQKARFAAFIQKLKGMMSKAFDLGRSDASLTPCPF